MSHERSSKASRSGSSLSGNSRSLHPLFVRANLREKEAGKEYNHGEIEREDYEVFQFRSWAHMCHFEATRICSFAEQKNAEKIQEHAADLVNYARFIYDEAQTYRERKATLESFVGDYCAYGKLGLAKDKCVECEHLDCEYRIKKEDVNK